MKERVKAIRIALDMSMESFGARLGVTRATISRIESGVNNVTPQMLISICREFNVNKEYLETGSGDMFVKVSDDEQLAKLLGAVFTDGDEFVKKTFLALGQLSPQQWQLVKDFVDIIKSGT